MFKNVNEIHDVGRTSDQESVAVSNTALRVFASSSWTGTTATANASVPRVVTLSNHDLSNGLFYAVGSSSTGANNLVTSSTGIYLGPGQLAAEIPVAQGEDLFVIRAAGTGVVTGWERTF